MESKSNGIPPKGSPEREKLRLHWIENFQKLINNAPDNYEIEPWTCKVCGRFSASRIMPYVEHCIAHVQANELEPLPPAPRAETVAANTRMIEID